LVTKKYLYIFALKKTNKYKKGITMQSYHTR